HELPRARPRAGRVSIQRRRPRLEGGRARGAPEYRAHPRHRLALRALLERGAAPVDPGHAARSESGAHGTAAVSVGSLGEDDAAASASTAPAAEVQLLTPENDTADPLLSIVVPALNEQLTIEEL